MRSRNFDPVEAELVRLIFTLYTEGHPADIIEIEVPVIVGLELFEQVQSRLSDHNPKVTPPRVANGQSLLVGLATCVSRRAGLTRTGTAKRGKA